MLPDGDGLALLREWRQEGRSTPVLALTARDLLADKIAGLDAGADDYLTKPFAFEELLARIRALLRRRPTQPMDVLAIADLTLDRTARRVRRGDREIELTPKEFALLEHFLLHPGATLTRAEIAEHVWDERYEARSNVIDVMVGAPAAQARSGRAPPGSFTPCRGWATPCVRARAANGTKPAAQPARAIAARDPALPLAQGRIRLVVRGHSPDALRSHRCLRVRPHPLEHPTRHPARRQDRSRDRRRLRRVERPAGSARARGAGARSLPDLDSPDPERSPSSPRLRAPRTFPS